MTTEHTPLTSGPGGLRVRGELILSADELAHLRAAVGDELTTSATLRSWIGGDATLPPHSVGVAVEAALRMLFGDPPEACALLSTVIDRLAEAFPDEVQPLDTT